jgi:Ku70/Ku80 N-terminal alpha/beta domain
MENPWGEEPEWAKEGTEADEQLFPDAEDDDFPWFGAQHILILIDCSSTMFKPCIHWTDNQRLSPMDASILACERLLRSRVLHVATQKTGKRDGIGVILFGGRTYDSYLEHDDADEDQITEQKSPTQILVDLNPPGIKEIQMLRSCLKDPVRGRSRDLRAEFQNNNYVDQARHLRIAMQLANKVFSEAKCVKSSRTLSSKVPRDLKSIWIFTNQDNPHQSQDEEKHQIHQIMTDIIDGGVEFAVWPLPKGNDVENFDPSLLYCHLPCHVMSRPIFDFMDMLETIACQSKKPRRVFRLPILFPDWKSRKEDPGIMVDFYNLIQEQKKPQLKWINQKTKQ